MADQEDRQEERPDRLADEEETMARLREEIENLPVREHVAYMMHSLSTLAIGRLGLTADTTARRDLGQARLAINAFKALLGVLEQVVPADEVSAHRGMLSQLQLAYAGATDRSGSSAKDDSAAAEPTPSPAETKHGEGEEGKDTGGEEAGEQKKPPASQKSSEAAKKSSTAPKKKSAATKKTSTAAKKKPAATKKASKPSTSS